jgi:hypothetical protein
MESEKICCTCKINKSLVNFNKNKNSEDGLQHQCKSCNKIYRENNKNKSRLDQKKWRDNNKERNEELKKGWLKKNIEKVRKNRNKRFNERYNTDPLEKLKKTIRVAFLRGIKQGYKKTNKTENVLGCTWEEFKIHIEKQFKLGMTWENHAYEGWHIDHIIPISSAKSEEEVYRLSHYTNFQPLWCDENLTKSNKII